MLSRLLNLGETYEPEDTPRPKPSSMKCNYNRKIVFVGVVRNEYLASFKLRPLGKLFGLPTTNDLNTQLKVP